MSTFDVMQGSSCNVSFFSCLIKGTLKIGNFDQHLQKDQMHLTQETQRHLCLYEFHHQERHLHLPPHSLHNLHLMFPTYHMGVGPYKQLQQHM